MKYIKLFENFDNSLQYFCETNLAYLLDDGPWKLKVTAKRKLIQRTSNVFKQSILLQKSDIHSVINITKRPEYFNWNDIKDYFIPFIIVLNENYGIINIVIGIRGGKFNNIKLSDIDKYSTNKDIKEIFITVKQ